MLEIVFSYTALAVVRNFYWYIVVLGEEVLLPSLDTEDHSIDMVGYYQEPGSDLKPMFDCTILFLYRSPLYLVAVVCDHLVFLLLDRFLTRHYS